MVWFHWGLEDPRYRIQWKFSFKSQFFLLLKKKKKTSCCGIFLLICSCCVFYLQEFWKSLVFVWLASYLCSSWSSKHSPDSLGSTVDEAQGDCWDQKTQCGGQRTQSCSTGLRLSHSCSVGSWFDWRFFLHQHEKKWE